MFPNKPQASTESLRELEAKLSKKKIRTALFTILNSFPVFGQLLNMQLAMNNNKLKKGVGVYEDYPYAKLDLDYDRIDKLMKMYPNNHKYTELFSDKYVLDDMLQRRLLVDANSDAQSTLLHFAYEVIDNISFLDEESIDNLLERSSLLGQYKGQMIVNHKTNSDALVMQYCFSWLQAKGCIPSEYKVRFIRGLHMASSPDVRAFSVGFNALDIFGPKDYVHMYRLLRNKQKTQDEYIELLKKEFPDTYMNYYDWGEYIDAQKIFQEMDNIKIEEMQSRKGTEVNLWFPSAGRIPGKGIIENNGLTNGVKPMLILPECIYLPVVFGGLTQFMKIGIPPLGKAIGIKKQGLYFKKGDIKIRVGKPFIGGSISPEEANQRLHDINFSLSNK